MRARVNTPTDTHRHPHARWGRRPPETTGIPSWTSGDSFYRQMLTLSLSIRACDYSSRGNSPVIPRRSRNGTESGRSPKNLPPRDPSVISRRRRVAANLGLDSGSRAPLLAASLCTIGLYGLHGLHGCCASLPTFLVPRSVKYPVRSDFTRPLSRAKSNTALASDLSLSLTLSLSPFRGERTNRRRASFSALPAR